MDLQVQKIKNYRHFLKLTTEFDNYYKTRTSIAFLTLAEINQILLKEDLYSKLEFLINNLFNKNSIVYSNESWLTDSHIGKLNALSKIIDDIRNGKGIISPISISYFRNNKIAIHPGSTRLLLADVYYEKIETVITDYTGQLEKHFSIDCVNPKSTNANTVIGMNFSVDSTALLDSPGVYQRVAPQNTIFKELTDHCLFYAKPTKAIPPRCYELKDNKIYIDGVCYILYNREKWTLVL